MAQSNRYVIYTDTTADLPREDLLRYEIQVLPMTYRLGGQESLYDGSWDEARVCAFYERLRGGEMATTSQIAPGTYEEAFTPWLEKGVDILYVCFSSGLSGTFQSALIASQMLMERFPGRKVIAVDSLGATFGEGLAVLHAAHNREQGMSIDENAKKVKARVLNNVHWFTVDDLMFLKRGGRISAATAILGTTLQIKPVMHVDDEGHLVPVEKAQGRRASLKAIARKMRDTGVELEKQTVYIGHGDARADAEFLADTIRNTVAVNGIHIGTISPIIGAHSGPGTIALFFVGSHR
jgi:DegV family protein with EDD domain